MNWQKNWSWVAWAVMMGLIAWAGAGVYRHGFDVRRDLFSVLPNSDRDQGFQKAQEVFRDRLGRELVLAVVDERPEVAESGAQSLVEHLESTGLFQNLQWRFDERTAESLYQFYSPYRAQLISPQKLEHWQNQTPQQILDSQLAGFYSPTGGGQVAGLATDPFGVLPGFLMGLSPENGPVVKNGYLVSEREGKTAAFVFGQIKGDWRDFERQTEVMRALDGFKLATVLRLGLVPYMKAGVEQAKVEISTIGLGSLIGSAAVVVLLFRSLVVLLASVALTSICLAIATLLSHAAFGSLHFFTLIFGSSLVGLFVDYSFHFFSQRFEEDVHNGSQARDKVKSALAYSFFSTVIGFSFLLLTPFPVLREMGAFAIVGFTSASLIIWTFFPLLPHRQLKIRSWWNKMGLGLKGIQNMRPQMFSTVMIGLMALTVAMTWQLRFDDDVKQLQGLPKDLRTQDDMIKSHLGGAAATEYFLVRAPTLDAALMQEENLSLQLRREALGSAYGLSRWVPSLRQQKASFSAYQRLQPIVSDYYRALKVPSAKQTQWLESQKRGFQPLDFFKWQSDLSRLPVAQQDLGEIDGQHYLAVRLEKIAKPSMLRKLDSANVQFVSPAGDTTDIITSLRKSIIYAGLTGAFVVFLFLVYMGGLNFAFYNVLAPLISAFLSLGFSSLVIGHVNLFNVLAAILVFALTIDYSFFYYDSRKSIAIPTLIAVSACILTTGLSFGLMSLSQTAAISGFGITIAFGIVLSYTLSPIALRTK